MTAIIDLAEAGRNGVSIVTVLTANSDSRTLSLPDTIFAHKLKAIRPGLTDGED